MLWFPTQLFGVQTGIQSRRDKRLSSKKQGSFYAFYSKPAATLSVTTIRERTYIDYHKNKRPQEKKSYRAKFQAFFEKGVVYFQKSCQGRWNSLMLSHFGIQNAFSCQRTLNSINLQIKFDYKYQNFHKLNQENEKGPVFPKLWQILQNLQRAICEFPKAQLKPFYHLLILILNFSIFIFQKTQFSQFFYLINLPQLIMFAKLSKKSLLSTICKFNCVYVKTVGSALPRGKLTIIPTPIGNLKDLSPNIIKALFEADLIGCEDRRVAGQLYHLIRSRNIIKEMEQNFGTLGLTNVMEIDPQLSVQEQKAHEFYNFSNMNQKERRKFLRKMTEEQQAAFRLQYLKYRALKILNKENEWAYTGTSDRLDELYGIDISDLKHIETQILNCRKRKGRGLLIPLNTYNETKMYDMVKALLESKKIAIVSDAGMPCISDPGWKLVDKLRKTMPDVPIEVVGGPSSVGILALQASLCSKGNSLSGRFEGFASLSTGNFQENNIELHNIKMKQFSINFINANKLKARLLDLQKKFGGDHKILLNNQLTKKYERRFQGSISQLLNKIDQADFKPVGEVSYLLYPSKEQMQTQLNSQKDQLDWKEQEKNSKLEGSRADEDLEQSLYTSFPIDIAEFLQKLESNEVKISSKQKCNLICTVFGVKKGQARKYVYDIFSKSQN